MRERRETKVQWFGWFGWFTNKVEAWLESQEGEGWHLVKADRLLSRFRFIRGEPRSVRIYIDYQGAADEEYTAIFSDAGWDLVDADLGWYIWRAEYKGDRRPEAYNDPQPLIDRSVRMLAILSAALAGLLVQIPIQMGLIRVTGKFFSTAFGKGLIAIYVVVVLVLTVSIGLAYTRLQRLKNQKP